MANVRAGTTLVVMAAGIGSRYGGLKQIESVGPGGETLLEYSVHDALRAGFGKLVFVLRRDIEQEFRKKIGRGIEERIPTEYVFQELTDLPAGFAPPPGRTKPWGTTHAVLCARPRIEVPFGVINADDFYGADALRLLHDDLEQADETGRRGRYVLVGYRLGHTLSEHGSVSRGICDIGGNGELRGIVERTEIQRFPDDVRYATGDARWEPLPEESVVSMNLWGFTPDVFEHLDAAFREFLSSEGASLKAESYLPAAIGALIEAGRIEVRVAETASRWFGVTNPEDRAGVESALRERVVRGEYPARLWA